MTTGLAVLRPDDASRLAALHADGFDAPWSEDSWSGLLAQPSTLCLGMETEAGELIGAIAVQFAADTSEILTLVVAKHKRRGGIASQLVEAVVARAGERGVGRILLDVSAENTGARKFYAASGFIEDGIRAAYYRNGSDGVLMSRKLGL